MSATLGVTRTMKSTILGEHRKAFVRLPTSYETSGNAYPVLYSLDGTPAFLVEMIAITTRLRNDHNAPEMIIVAIENTNRNRDMMPVVAKDYPGPPRAEAFLERSDFVPIRHLRELSSRSVPVSTTACDL